MFYLRKKHFSWSKKWSECNLIIITLRNKLFNWRCICMLMLLCEKWIIILLLVCFHPCETTEKSLVSLQAMYSHCLAWFLFAQSIPTKIYALLAKSPFCRVNSVLSLIFFPETNTGQASPASFPSTHQSDAGGCACDICFLCIEMLSGLWQQAPFALPTAFRVWFRCTNSHGRNFLLLFPQVSNEWKVNSLSYFFSFR